MVNYKDYEDIYIDVIELDGKEFIRCEGVVKGYHHGYTVNLGVIIYDIPLWLYEDMSRFFGWIKN